ncbi:hypothetical protein [Pseudomonas sp. 43NM1]|uniref:hypothetical protein n=1 Tax=Pseudomonas sp. 43NM1 TaxID=1904755 RepID=UPI0021140927|nr:hypothetical protein [Pseudomonas sp. 43NM1]
MERIALIVIGLFFCVLLTGISVPLYSDEIVSKWSVSRFFLEDMKLVSFFPQCSTMSDRAVSWVFYPAAALISGVYANLGPLGIRISGIVFAVIWFGLLGAWCLQQTDNRTLAIKRLAGLLAFSALGVLPYLLVLSRSEQFMTLPILIFCITATQLQGQKTLPMQSITALAQVFVLSCFFYVHPKSLFFLPFVLLALWLVTKRDHVLIRTGLLIYTLLLFFQVLQESNAIAACQDAPAMQAMLAANTLLPKMMFSAPVEFFTAATDNLVRFPDRLLTHLTFNPTSQSGWLPPIETSEAWLVYLNLAVQYLLYSFIVGMHIASLIFFIVKIAKRQLCAPITLAALLASADIFNALFFNIQNFYAATQFLPISLILAALLMQAQVLPKRCNYLMIGYSSLLIVAILSMLTLLLKVFPATISNAAYSQATLPGQPLSIAVFNVPSHLKSIEKLGASCGLSTENAKNMVVDHMTYFAYLKVKKPVHVLYVSEYGFGGDLSNGRLLPFLKKLESPGLITRCEWMPLKFRDVQKSDDAGYCCVNLDDL